MPCRALEIKAPATQKASIVMKKEGRPKPLGIYILYLLRAVTLKLTRSWKQAKKARKTSPTHDQSLNLLESEWHPSSCCWDRARTKTNKPARRQAKANNSIDAFVRRPQNSNSESRTPPPPITTSKHHKIELAAPPLTLVKNTYTHFGVAQKAGKKAPPILSRHQNEP